MTVIANKLYCSQYILYECYKGAFTFEIDIYSGHSSAFEHIV